MRAWSTACGCSPFLVMQGERSTNADRINRSLCFADATAAAAAACGFGYLCQPNLIFLSIH
jgi:hypothetical protein